MIWAFFGVYPIDQMYQKTGTETKLSRHVTKAVGIGYSTEYVVCAPG